MFGGSGVGEESNVSGLVHVLLIELCCWGGRGVGVINYSGGPPSLGCTACTARRSGEHCPGSYLTPGVLADQLARRSSSVTGARLEAMGSFSARSLIHRGYRRSKKKKICKYVSMYACM